MFWRRTEEAVTGMTRNHFVGQLARGFESHRLRIAKPRNADLTVFLGSFFACFLNGV